MTDNRNTILAVILSGIVLIAWQYFYNVPQMEKQRAQTQTQAELAKPTPQTAPGSTRQKRFRAKWVPVRVKKPRPKRIWRHAATRMTRP